MASPEKSQFSLRILFGLTLFAGLIFGLFRWVDTFWSSMLAWLLVLIAAHVLATKLGNRSLERPATRTSDSDRGEPGQRVRKVTAPNWEDSQSTKKVKQVIGSTAAGMGGCAGSVLIFWQTSQSVSIPGVCVAGISTAVLLGLLAFGVSNVVEVSWKLLNQLPD